MAETASLRGKERVGDISGRGGKEGKEEEGGGEVMVWSRRRELGRFGLEGRCFNFSVLDLRVLPSTRSIR